MLRHHKNCAVCGRRMDWRKRWRNNWQSVKYCSSSCRRSSRDVERHNLETRILAMLNQQPGKACLDLDGMTAKLFDASSRSFHQHRVSVHNAARRLCNRGVTSLFRQGRPVDPSKANRTACIKLNPSHHRQ